MKNEAAAELLILMEQKGLHLKLLDMGRGE